MTTGVLEAMAAFGGQSIASLENLPSATGRTGSIVAQAPAAMARIDRLTQGM